MEQKKTTRQLQLSGVEKAPPRELLEILVTTFRELRSGLSQDGQALERLSTSLSTAEAVTVAQSLGIRSHYLRQSEPLAEDLMECILGTALKDDLEMQRLRRYLEQRVARRTGPAWKAFYEARHRLP